LSTAPILNKKKSFLLYFESECMVFEIIEVSTIFVQAFHYNFSSKFVRIYCAHPVDLVDFKR
jgi:hypothetical protein